VKEGTVCVGFLDNDTWSACFGLSLRDLLLTDATHWKRIVPDGRELRYLAPSGGIVEGRNTIARQFLDETECEWLWFVDSDMGFGPSTVEDLIRSAEEADAKVVGALCFGLKKEASSGFYSSVMDMVPTLYDWYEDDDKAGFVARLDYQVDTLQPVIATGAACILIHRSCSSGSGRSTGITGSTRSRTRRARRSPRTSRSASGSRR
jgi:hypothetical protein